MRWLKSKHVRPAMNIDELNYLLNKQFDSQKNKVNQKVFLPSIKHEWVAGGGLARWLLALSSFFFKKMLYLKIFFKNVPAGRNSK